MKRTLLLSMIAAGLLTSPLAFAEGGKDGGPDGKHHKGQMMEEVDTNGDGAISKEEFMSKHEEHFSKVDADGDGSLSKEEMKASWDARKEKMKERRDERHEKRGDMKDKAAVDADVDVDVDAASDAPAEVDAE